MVKVDMVSTTQHRLTSGERPYEGQRPTVSLDMRHYLWVLQRQWLAIFICTFLGASTAFTFLVMSPKVVTAITTLQLNVIMTEPFSSQRPASGLLDASTEANIARSHVVADRASVLLGGAMSATDIRTVSEITLGAGATVVDITFDGNTANEAITGANAVADAYLGFRSDQAGARVDTIVTTLSDQIDALNLTLNETNETITTTSETSTQHIQALTQQQQILTELDGLLSERNALRSVDTTGGLVLSAAEHNALIYSPSTLRTLALGIGAGLVLGVIVAFIRNPFDTRVRSAQEVSRALAAPILTASPPQHSRSRRHKSGVHYDAIPLQIATERLLTDVEPGATLTIIDAVQTEKPSQTLHFIMDRLDARAHYVRILSPAIDDPSGVIAALRSSDASLLIFERSAVDIQTLRWFASEARASHTRVLGVVEHAISKGRR